MSIEDNFEKLRKEYVRLSKELRAKSEEVSKHWESIKNPQGIYQATNLEILRRITKAREELDQIKKQLDDVGTKLLAKIPKS
jgi:chromosome segregation ATPase